MQTKIYMIILIDSNIKKTLLSNFNDESDYNLGTKWWRTMVNGGERWLTMVNGGEWWWTMVNGREWWWTMGNGGERRGTVVKVGVSQVGVCEADTREKKKEMRKKLRKNKHYI